MSASAGLERTMRDPDQGTLSVYGALHLAGCMPRPPSMTGR